MQRKYLFYTVTFYLTGIMFFLVNCSAGQPPDLGSTLTTSPETTNTVSPTHDKILTFTPSPSTTLTPFPTLEDPVTFLTDLLQTNGSCDLPCIWGITPGSITITRAIEYFQSIPLSGEYLDEPGHPYVFFVSEYNLGVSRVEIRGGNGLVESISISQLTPYPGITANYFSLLNVIEDLGIPSLVFIDLGYSSTGGLTDDPAVVQVQTELFFETAKVYVAYEGLARKMGDAFIFCPSQPDTKGEELGHIRVCSGLGERWEDYQGSLCDPEVMFNAMTSDEAISLSASEFTEQIIQTQGEACFTTPRSIWP